MSTTAITAVFRALHRPAVASAKAVPVPPRIFLRAPCSRVPAPQGARRLEGCSLKRLPSSLLALPSVCLLLGREPSYAVRHISSKVNDEEATNPNRATREQQWLSMLSKLHVFWGAHGHSKVPRSWPEDPKLATWVATQRAAKKKLDRGDVKPGITPERVAKLDELGFEWVPLQTIGMVDESRWKAMLERLEAFETDYGHCNVSWYWSDRKLAYWVSNQRTAKTRFDRGDGRPGITPERVQKLEAMGFEWNLADARWKSNLARLYDFKDEHGHCNVPDRWIVDSQLGTWVSKQRTYKRRLDRGDAKAGITPERVSQLDKIGFEWNRGR
jgi:hypothetical protein